MPKTVLQLNPRPAWLRAVLMTRGQVGLADVQISIIYRLNGCAHLLLPPKLPNAHNLPPHIRGKVEKLYNWLREHAVITPKHAMLILNCSYPTARKYLDILRRCLGLPPRRKYKNSTIKAWEVVRFWSLRQQAQLSLGLGERGEENGEDKGPLGL